MAGMDDADFVTGIVEGVKEVVILHTGQGEKGVNTVCDQGLNDGLATGCFGHKGGVLSLI